MSVLKRKVLQLNATYEPHSVIDVRDAHKLLMRRDAHDRPVAQVIELEADIPLRSASRSFELPSVIRLMHFVDLRKAQDESGKKRHHIFVRDRFRCLYCYVKFPASELTLDHILPRSRGGLDDPRNLASSCEPCNQRKGDRTPDEARMPLLATPSALRYGLDRAMLDHYAESRPKWHPYVVAYADGRGDPRYAILDTGGAVM